MRTFFTALVLLAGLATAASAQPPPAQPPPAGQPGAAPGAVPTATGQAVVPPSASQPGLVAPPPGAAATPAGAARPKAKREMPPVPARTDLERESYWMPPDASTSAEPVDWLFYGIVALSVFCFVAITIVTVYFTWRYRSRPGHKAVDSTSHNDLMEIVWTVIPSIICVFIFIFGWKAFLDLQTPPEHAIEIKVTAEKWNWSFTYPNGFVDANLHAPVGKPVRLVMRSKDVLHSLWVPAFRIKQDVIPNRYTKLWFEATRAGVFRLYCTEFCGTGHSKMKHLVQIHEPGGFERWMEEAEAAMLDMPPAELGKYMYTNRGCVQCHSVDGSAKTGPTWKGLWGTTRSLADGATVMVDENYIRESILEPKNKVAAGFSPVMPTFKGQLKDEHIDGLIEYIKTLK